MRRIFYFFVFLVTGCEEMVEVNVKETHESNLVVSTYLTPSEKSSVYVTYTHPAYTAFAPGVDDISVSIECTNSESAFNLFPSSLNGRTTFSSDELTFEEGGIYRLSVEALKKKNSAQATDTIPYAASLHNVTVHPVKDDSPYQVSISINPYADNLDNSFYEVAVFLAEVWNSTQDTVFYEKPTSLISYNPIITREDYYPDLMLIGSRDPETLLFRIQRSAGNVKIDFQYETSSGWNPSTGYRFPEHYVKVELRTVSRAYFNYKTSLYKQINAVEGDFLYGIAPPVTVNSNITGGFGVFAGYSKTDTIIHLPARTIE
ncbi:MAG: DUF4249 family protein [Bacteroidales bacterium]